MKDNKETRHVVAEIRAAGDSRLVEGYAALFDSPSDDLGGFTETIAPEAFEGVIERSDVLCLLDHDKGRGVLARSRKGEGSLALSIDERGLHYSFDAPKTALGDELLEGIRRGDITASSFCFTVAAEEWAGERGARRRRINKVGSLYDVSPVYTPAYPDTSVALRSLKEKEEEETPLYTIDTRVL